MERRLKIYSLAVICGLAVALVAGEECMDQQADMDTAQYCGSAIQQTCSHIIDQGYCSNVNRKDREKVTQDCEAAADKNCEQQSVLCYTEYDCVWQTETGLCKNGLIVSTAQTLAKKTSDCPEPE